MGDRFKILRKPGRYGDFKSDFVAWSEIAYRVEEITYDAGHPVFKLEGRPKPLRLHEIFKVDGVEKALQLKKKEVRIKSLHSCDGSVLRQLPQEHKKPQNPLEPPEHKELSQLLWQSPRYQRNLD